MQDLRDIIEKLEGGVHHAKKIVGMHFANIKSLSSQKDQAKAELQSLKQSLTDVENQKQAIKTRIRDLEDTLAHTHYSHNEARIDLMHQTGQLHMARAVFEHKYNRPQQPSPNDHEQHKANDHEQQEARAHQAKAEYESRDSRQYRFPPRQEEQFNHAREANERAKKEHARQEQLNRADQERLNKEHAGRQRERMDHERTQQHYQVPAGYVQQANGLYLGPGGHMYKMRFPSYV